MCHFEGGAVSFRCALDEDADVVNQRRGWPRCSLRLQNQVVREELRGISLFLASVTYLDVVILAVLLPDDGLVVDLFPPRYTDLDLNLIAI